jgi:hypothetical protein
MKELYQNVRASKLQRYFSYTYVQAVWLRPWTVADEILQKGKLKVSDTDAVSELLASTVQLFPKRWALVYMYLSLRTSKI